MIALALYQPDIPQNAGNILRLGACLGVPVHLIGPAGFDMSDRALRRSAMDYLGHAEILQACRLESLRGWRGGRPGSGSCCSPRGPTFPISTSPSAPTTSCSSAGKAPACRTRSMPPPMRGSWSRCGRGCARSTSRRPRPWCSARPCGRPAASPAIATAAAKRVNAPVDLSADGSRCPCPPTSTRRRSAPSSGSCSSATGSPRRSSRSRPSCRRTCRSPTGRRAG